MVVLQSKKTGIADLPLHYGSAPRWLFERMVKLSKPIATLIIEDYGSKEFLKRLSDPYWFQAFGCVLGFDWHSSGLTTTVCGALKQAGLEEQGIKICGGKGKASLKTVEEIKKSELGEKKTEELIKASRLSAKVDNSCIQDGYELYHHVFVFDEKGCWSVVQQGMNEKNGYARRYHWFSGEVKSFVEEPEKIACDKKEEKVLDLVSKKSKKAQKASLDALKEKDFLKLEKLRLPRQHSIMLTAAEKKFLEKISELDLKDYEELVSLKGIGKKKLRALALTAELVYGEKASWEDPVKYSFAHGGKDGIPYPVDRALYDDTVKFLEEAVEGSEIERKEKRLALKRLREFIK